MSTTTTARHRRGDAALLILRETLLACAAGLAGVIGISLWRLVSGS